MLKDVGHEETYEEQSLDKEDKTFLMILLCLSVIVIFIGVIY